MRDDPTSLNDVFSCLADPTRRDILRRLAIKPLNVSEIASAYPVSLPMISKHLNVLETAGLIIRHRVGKQIYISLAPYALHDAGRYLDAYRLGWGDHVASLEQYLHED